MKKFLIILIILGTWAVLDPGAVVNADEDLMTAAGVVKFKDRISAPLFTIEDLAGESINLQDFQGKVVLLNFWATW